MHEFSELQQAFIFFVEGTCISFLFDFFRGLRKNFNSSNFSVFIEDFLFLTIASIVIVGSIIFVSNGIIRGYIFLSIFLGIIAYTLTLSKNCVIIFENLIKIFNSFFTFLLKFVKKLGNLF